MSAAIAPHSDRLTDRFGGKYILATGLGLFALLAALTHDGTRWPPAARTRLRRRGDGDDLRTRPGVIAFGDIAPAEAGSASGVFNTAHLYGSLLGSASVGALLQTDLTSRDTTTALRITYLLPVAILLSTLLAVRTPSRTRNIDRQLLQSNSSD